MSAPAPTCRGSALALLAAGAVAGPAAAQTLLIIDNPALGKFIDISRSGQPIALQEDGEAMLAGTFAGNFVFRAGQIAVGQNGGLSFGQFTLTDLAPDNEPIPSDAAFAGGQAALVLWDDIDDKEGDVHSLLLPDRRIVQWSWANFDGAGGTLRFQVQVFDSAAPSGIYAQYLYQIEGGGGAAGAGATIGYQDGGAGFGDHQFSLDRPGAVQDGTVLSLAILGACAADIDGDGAVGLGDLLAVILEWGCTGRCAADIDLDGIVGVSDLVYTIRTWGECP